MSADGRWLDDEDEDRMRTRETGLVRTVGWPGHADVVTVRWMKVRLSTGKTAWRWVGNGRTFGGEWWSAEDIEDAWDAAKCDWSVTVARYGASSSLQRETSE